MTSSLLRSFCLALTLASLLHARTYHIDASASDDSRDGLTPASAWKSLEKFNATVFQADDHILFKSGQHWLGQLRPHGSGSAMSQANHPITIGRYGDGDLPEIRGAGRFLETILIEDVEFWTLSDLAVTNLGASTAPGRSGVRIHAQALKLMRGITLRGLHVYDVNGDLRKSHEGQGILFEANAKTHCAFDGILIENCRLERTDRNGICQRGLGDTRSKHVIIRSNILDDIGGDAIKLWGTNGGIIEKNIVRNARARCSDNAAAIWPFACDDTLIQYNEVSGTKGTKDGQAFDADYLCKRTIIQYNYSYQNEGGFILICSPGNSYNLNTIVRNNVSVNDGVNSGRVIQIGGNPTNTLFQNNTIVIGPQQCLPMISFNEWDGGKASNTRFLSNSLVVSDGGKATYDLAVGTNTRFTGNLFVGRHEGLPEGVRTEPPALPNTVDLSDAGTRQEEEAGILPGTSFQTTRSAKSTLLPALPGGSPQAPAASAATAPITHSKPLSNFPNP